MVEIPAAALTAAHLAEHVDFFSLGTNDLTQYTMAAERGDERLAGLLAGPQPAVLRLVKATVEAAAARGRWVGVCGELAGDPAAAVLLAGLGRHGAEHGAGPRRRRPRRRCARSISPTRARRRTPRSTPRTPMRRADSPPPCSDVASRPWRPAP